MKGRGTEYNNAVIYKQAAMLKVRLNDKVGLNSAKHKEVLVYFVLS
jgi:hypothetical protein